MAEENNSRSLFRRLTRLFSGPIVNWRTQMNRKIRRTALDKYSSDFRSASGQQFKRSEYSPFDIMHSKIMAQQNRAERYVDYEQMEYMPEIASAMLQRQQAEALIDARSLIVQGAVDIARNASEQLKTHGIEMAQTEKARMVSNLICVICGDDVWLICCVFV